MPEEKVEAQSESTEEQAKAEVKEENAGKAAEVEAAPAEAAEKAEETKAAKEAAPEAEAESAEEKKAAAEEPAAEPAKAEEKKAEAAPAAEPAKAEAKKEPVAKPKPAKAEKRAPVVDDIMASVKKMTVLELSQLVKAMEEEFGVSAAPPAVTAAAPTAAAEGGAPAAAEEKTEFNVILKEVGANKISVIKTVRELTSLGLKESKDLVEGAPKPVKEGVNKDEAAAAKKKLEEAGATAEVV